MKQKSFVLPSSYFEIQEGPIMDHVKPDASSITQITLCGTQGCCPVVEIHRDSRMVVITDDDGGKVSLTFEQWQFALANAHTEAR